MQPTDYAAAVQHTRNIIRAAIVDFKVRRGRTKILTSAADELEMRPSTLRAALTESPGTAAHIRALLRVKCYRAAPVMLSPPNWTITTWTGGDLESWSTDFYQLYDEAAGKRVLSDARKWYSTLSDDVYTVPLLMVEILARLVGYPCAFRVAVNAAERGDRGGVIWHDRYNCCSPDRTGPSDLASLMATYPDLTRDLEAGTWNR